MELKQLLDQLDRGLGMFLATRDENMFPDLTDAMGVRLAETGQVMTVYIFKSESEQALANMARNGQVALSVSRPCDYFAAQIKGKVVKIRPMTADERAHSKICGDKYREEIQLIGLPSSVAQTVSWDPDLAIDVEVTDIFIQTPGPGAGRKMERP